MGHALSLLALVACGHGSEPAADAPAPIDAAPDAAVPVPRLYALTGTLTKGGFDFSVTSKIGLEVIDLRTMTLSRNVDLSFGGISSMAVSPNGTILYLADFANSEVRFVDSTTGMTLHAVPLAGVRDLVLSADGGKLFASSRNTLVAIDTTTRMTTASPNLGMASTFSLGIAVSPDGARLATATSDGGTNPAVALVRTADMSVEATVPMVTDVMGCGASPAAVAFKTTGLLVSWDANCDELYQVDVGTHTQLTAGSIPTGRDSGARSYFNQLTLSAASGLTYAVREEGNLAAMNPQTKTFAVLNGFTGTPFASAMSVEGAKLFVSVSPFQVAGADTLDVLDTASTGFQRAAYTFSVPTQHVIEMVAVTSP